MVETQAPYPRELRGEAVRRALVGLLVLQSDESIARITKELGVSDHSIGNWVERTTLNKTGGKSRPSPRSSHRDTAVSVTSTERILETPQPKVPVYQRVAFALAIILGVVTGLAVARTSVEQILSSFQVAAWSRSSPSLSLPDGIATNPQPSASAWTLLREGRLQEAQDTFLEILQTQPDRSDLWRGLVTVRTRMARGDPTVLRQQTRMYEGAIRRGGDTKEYYTPAAMQLLAAASYQAALEIERQRDPSHHGVLESPGLGKTGFR